MSHQNIRENQRNPRLETVIELQNQRDMNSLQQSKVGLTIIELVVVMMILGILLTIGIPKLVDITESADKSHDYGMLSGLRAATLMLYANNCVTNGLQKHGGVTNYWPLESDITNQMTQAIVWRHFAIHTYNPTTGVWTISE